MSTLILLRHGNSDWNQKNLFTGWVDVRLSDQGVIEARRAGELLAESGLKPIVSYTSVLTRAIQTADIALLGADRAWIPVKRSWRLNERHYGALQGLDKAETLAKFGEEQFMQWRRSFDVPPPPLDDDAKWSQFGDERYADVPDADFPRTESLKLVIDRMLPYWESDIVPSLREGTVIVTAHGNSLRALVKHLDGISDDEIAELNIPTGIPLVYELGDDFMPTAPGALPRPRRGRRRRCGRREPGQEVGRVFEIGFAVEVDPEFPGGRRRGAGADPRRACRGSARFFGSPRRALRPGTSRSVRRTGGARRSRPAIAFISDWRGYVVDVVERRVLVEVPGVTPHSSGRAKRSAPADHPRPI